MEVVRHVNVGHDLIRPTTERLSGTRVINSYFTSNPDKDQLARSARELMQTELGSESRSYNAVGGRWIPSSLPPPGPVSTVRPAPSVATALENRVGELSAQVVLLAAVQEGLLARLARLEAKLLEWGSAPRPPPQRAERFAFSGRESVAEEAPGFDDDAAAEGEPAEAEAFDDEPPLDESEPFEQQTSDEAQPEEAEPLEQQAAEAPAAPVADERSELRLPHASDLAKCMELLIGGELTVEETEPMAVNRTTRDCYAASLIDDTDRTIGLILMDLKATVFLGGTLMMLPRGELDQQLRSFSPGEDSIAASAEICNALTGAINGAQEQHVRASALEKFDFRRASWVTDPAHRRDLLDSFGGRSAVFSRRVEPPVG